MPSNDKISSMTAAIAGDLVGSTTRIEVSSLYTTVPATLGCTLALLRTTMFAGGSGYTATDPLTCGAISSSGDFAIATSKFTVAAASGNTVVAGTLGVTGRLSTSSNFSFGGNFTPKSTPAGYVFAVLGNASNEFLGGQDDWFITQNVYYDGGWKTITASTAPTYYNQADGHHRFAVGAGAGGAGVATTMTIVADVIATGLSVLTTTQSTSTTTGALVVSGGLGVAKAAFFGEAVTFANNVIIGAKLSGGTVKQVFAATGADGLVFGDGSGWTDIKIYPGSNNYLTISTAGLLTTPSLSVTGTSTLTGNCGIGEASTATSVLHIKKASLPTSAAGLATGDVWNNSGVLTIV